MQKYERLGLPYRLEGVEPMDRGGPKELEIYANKVFAEGLRSSAKSKLKKLRGQPEKPEAAAADLGKSALLSILRSQPLFSDFAEDVQDVLSRWS